MHWKLYGSTTEYKTTFYYTALGDSYQLLKNIIETSQKHDFAELSWCFRYFFDCAGVELMNNCSMCYSDQKTESV